MTDSTDVRSFRVERGHASAEELAAVIAVLLARTAGEAEPPATVVTVPAARWRRSERAHLFNAPRVWHPYERAAA
jgi:hypothetical protein